MKGFLAFLLLAGATAGGVYFYMQKTQVDPYGIGPDAPLGKLEKIDAVLRAKGIQRKERTFLSVECLDSSTYEALQDLKVYDYDDGAQGLKTSVRHQVLVAVDDGGAVRAVAGQFASGAREFMVANSSRVESVLTRYWLAATGTEAKFVLMNEPTTDEDPVQVSRFDGRGIHGHWRRKAPGGSGEGLGGPAIYDRLILWIE